MSLLARDGEVQMRIMQHATRLDGARVLLVEDDPDTRELVAEFLEMLGATVATAGNASSGFDAFARERPALVVSDLWMPEGDGFTLIRRIRSLSFEEGALTPAIAMSAAENVKSAIGAGFHAFLAKPFDFERLASTIHDFVGASAPQMICPWTIQAHPGVVTITFVGSLEREDANLLAQALLVHLERGPVEIVSDFRRLEKFAPSVASVVERAIYPMRHRIIRLHLVGGSILATLTGVAMCRVLGIPCVRVEAPEDDPARA